MSNEFSMFFLQVNIASCLKKQFIYDIFGFTAYIVFKSCPLLSRFYFIIPRTQIYSMYESNLSQFFL